MEDMVATIWAKENSRAVSRYLSCLQWVVAFLRPLQEPDLEDQESLLKVTRKVMDHQEQKLKKTLLEPMDYELEDEVIRSIMKLGAQRGRGGIMNRIEGVRSSSCPLPSQRELNSVWLIVDSTRSVHRHAIPSWAHDSQPDLHHGRGRVRESVPHGRLLNRSVV